jgi:small subunit ribosomal protein S6
LLEGTDPGLDTQKEKQMAQLKSLADAPGTQREYETIYILRPDTPNDRVAEINTKVRGIIEGMGGKVLAVDNWGKRKLSYEISKELKGIYLFWKYLAGSDVVPEFERNMRMLDTVIRYMTVVAERSVDPASRTSDVTPETYEKAAQTAADEEELMMRRSEAEAEAEAEAAAAGDSGEGGEGGEAAEGEDAAADADAAGDSVGPAEDKN